MLLKSTQCTMVQIGGSEINDQKEFRSKNFWSKNLGSKKNLIKKFIGAEKSSGEVQSRGDLIPPPPKKKKKQILELNCVGLLLVLLGEVVYKISDLYDLYF